MDVGHEAQGPTRAGARLHDHVAGHRRRLPPGIHHVLHAGKSRGSAPMAPGRLVIGHQASADARYFPGWYATSDRRADRDAATSQGDPEQDGRDPAPHLNLDFT